jgi:hypothetical protein
MCAAVFFFMQSVLYLPGNSPFANILRFCVFSLSAFLDNFLSSSFSPWPPPSTSVLVI